MSDQVEEEITVTGTLFSVTLFEEKLMKNFLLISNKLRKLEGLLDLQQRNKALEKQFKFLSMKVETIVEKLPKESSLGRNDIRAIAKETVFDILNANDEMLSKSKYHVELLNEITKIKEEPTNHIKNNKHERKEGVKTSFTAGQALRDTEKIAIKVNKQTLQGVLDDKQMEIVNSIIDEKVDEENIGSQVNQIQDFSKKLENLTKIVEQLRLGRGYASYLERQSEKFEKFQQFQQKSRQTTRKVKQKPIQLQGVKQQNVKGQILKLQLLNEVQRMEVNKQEIAKQQLIQRKTAYSNLFPQVRQTKEIKEINRDFKETKQIKEIKDIMKEKEKDNVFRKSQSIRKIDRQDKRLKVDDFKDLNGVLREIQLRIQTKVSHDIFMGFVKDFEEKLQVLRLSKDTGAEINELRKNIFVLESKMQSVVSYLQSIAQEDEALMVKKQWTCVSCDKGLDKYQGKVGQHLNWDNMNAKKMSPLKVGAFGQTGQLAAKIRNLMDGDAE